MHRFINGLQKFQTQIFGPQREMFQRLAKGQSPETLFITCSDSRIVPNELTQTGPGELFILRNAGNLVPAHGGPGNGEAATIEFAVSGLGVKEIIVCGHSQCGAMKGLLHPEQIKNLPAMKEWLVHSGCTLQVLQEHYSALSPEEQLQKAIELNVLVQLDHLRTHPSVQRRLLMGELTLHGWVFALESGEVRSYDATPGRFVSLTNAAPTLALPESSSRAAI